MAADGSLMASGSTPPKIQSVTLSDNNNNNRPRWPQLSLSDGSSSSSCQWLPSLQRNHRGRYTVSATVMFSRRSVAVRAAISFLLLLFFMTSILLLSLLRDPQFYRRVERLVGLQSDHAAYWHNDQNAMINSYTMAKPSESKTSSSSDSEASERGSSSVKENDGDGDRHSLQHLHDADSPSSRGEEEEEEGMELKLVDVAHGHNHGRRREEGEKMLENGGDGRNVGVEIAAAAGSSPIELNSDGESNFSVFRHGNGYGYNPYNDDDDDDARYLMMICNFGRMSNRMDCIRKYLAASTFLNRTLVFPLFDKMFPFADVFDMARISFCLGNSSVISFAEFRQRMGRSGEDHIDLMRIVPTKHFHKLSAVVLQQFLNETNLQVKRMENFTGQEEGESTSQFFRRFDAPNEKVISMGEGFDIRIGEEAPANSSCRGFNLQPHPNILKAAMGFVRTFLGSHYTSIHLRRGDFLHYCGEQNCFFPIPQLAVCLLRQLQALNTSDMATGSMIVYLATDASANEVHELTTLMNKADPKGPTLVTLSGMGETTTGRLDGMSREDWNTPLTDAQLNLGETRAMVDRTICSLADTFLSSRLSTFSREVGRLRNGWGLTGQGDSLICRGIRPDWKRSPSGW